MNILVLCKRRYMSRDLIGERYGRLYHLPVELAARGHQVEVLCLDYPWCAVTSRNRDEDGVWGRSHAFPWGGFSFARRAVRLGRSMKADLVLGMADSIYGVWAQAVADELGCGFAFDLYDNFETFTNIKLPGMPANYRRALREDRVVSCVSDRLAEHVRDKYSPLGCVVTVPSVVDPELFGPLDKRACRRELGLPSDAPLVGYFGAIDHNRGIDDLFRGWRQISQQHPDAWLILAGKVGRGVNVPGAECHVQYLGLLPFRKMPSCINACDVVTIFNIDSPFGRHAFPQKLCETMACGVPIVATNVGAVGDFLKPWRCCTYPLGRPDRFAERALAFLDGLKVDYREVPTWANVVTPWEEQLTDAVARQASRVPSKSENRVG